MCVFDLGLADVNLNLKGTLNLIRIKHHNVLHSQICQITIKFACYCANTQEIHNLLMLKM